MVKTIKTNQMRKEEENEQQNEQQNKEENENQEGQNENQEGQNEYEWDYTTLVLSGGGIRGIALVGALLVLDEHKCLDKIKTYAGTSIGALICGMLSMGYTLEELCKEMWITDLQQLRDIDVWHFFENFGLDTGKKIIEWLERMCVEKGVNPNLTFKELYDSTGKVLILTGTLVNEHKLELFSHKTNPRMKIVKAMRISSSMPFLYAAPNYKNNYYSDGGILDNYPISCLCNYIDNEEHILGVKLIHDFTLRKRVQINKKEFKKFTTHLMYTLLDENNRLRHLLSKYERPYENLVTIEIDTKGISSIPIQLTDRDKRMLYSVGQYHAANWLETMIEEKRNNYNDSNE